MYADPVSTRNSKSCPTTLTGTNKTLPLPMRPGTRLERAKADRQAFGDGIAGKEDEEAGIEMRGAEDTCQVVQLATVACVRDYLALDWHISAVDTRHAHSNPVTAVSLAGGLDLHTPRVPNPSCGSQQ